MRNQLLLIVLFSSIAAILAGCAVDGLPRVHHLAQEGDAAALESSEELNSEDQYGMTPLMRAANMGHLRAVQVLVSKGADINKPLLWRSQYPNAGANGWTAIFFAALRGHSEIVALLAEWGAKLSHIDINGETVLMVAASHGRTAILECLIQKGAEVDARDNYNRTTLMLAAAEGHSDAVQVLLKNGADVNAKDQSGRTALAYSTSPSMTIAVASGVVRQSVRAPGQGQARVAEILRQAGAK